MQTRRMPGEEGVWVLIFGDILIFSVFFATFLFYRASNTALFAESQAHLNQGFGALNTIFMLTSSWFVVLAVQAARIKRGTMTPRLFMLAFACGFGFGVVKILEYREKIAAGITLNTNDFFMFYYIFTGIHFMHVLIGMGVLAFLARYSVAGNLNDKQIKNLESGASFWHVVDLLWIMLFALLYLVK